MALVRDQKELDSRDWLNLANYISEMEKGYTTPPFLRSLYCFYYATVEMVSQNQLFKELSNCQMEWIDQQKARVVLPESVEKDEVGWIDIVPDDPTVFATDRNRTLELQSFGHLVF
jgi:hypothetical protein